MHGLSIGCCEGCGVSCVSVCVHKHPSWEGTQQWRTSPGRGQEEAAGAREPMLMPCLLWFAGPPQQYSGQEDYYGDQYGHGGQGPPEGMSQQYYPDGNPPTRIPRVCPCPMSL